MSRQNKVNPGQYTSAGRLSPDDLGRQRTEKHGTTESTGGRKAKKPAWETTSPAPKVEPPAPPSRLKIAAAHSVIGVTRATAVAVKTLTKAAKKVVATGAPRATATVKTKGVKTQTAKTAKRR